ncbi:hypothetical protein [Microbacterium sp. CFBP9034]|uniref:hypothetical protein n=1 Tax=Microbacterium sp. CFBP9034 TaxID=3096540 RepID=UPI002A6AFFBC|nr:hypothetical protein [Microbacterium sp. CFBP9034]MDY0910550.1 hypothetical protein [Microbacterium sp. CFBP9034]
MRTPSTSRRFAALTLTAVALLGLTGCTGFPTGASTPGVSPTSSADAEGGADDGSGEGSSDGSQTTEEACQLVQDTITDATAEFENVDGQDPSAVVDGMKAAAERLAETSSQITNEEVAAVVPSLQQMFEQVAEVMAAIVDGETDRLGELEEIGTTFQETTEQFQELCAPTE